MAKNTKLKETTKQDKIQLKSIIEQAEDIKQVLRKGGYNVPKYRPGYHEMLLIDLFVEGGGLEEFCTHAMVSRATVYVWLDQYPNFKIAYELARDLGHQAWRNLALQNRDLDHKIWYAIGKGRYGWGKIRLRQTSGTTALDKISGLWDEIQKDGVEADVVTKLAQLIAVHANIEKGNKDSNMPISGEDLNFDKMEAMEKIDRFLELHDSQK